MSFLCDDIIQRGASHEHLWSVQVGRAKLAGGVRWEPEKYSDEGGVGAFFERSDMVESLRLECGDQMKSTP